MSRIAVAVGATLLLVLVLTAPASADLPYAVPTPVATGLGTQGAPSLGGGTWDTAVAWEDDTSGQWDVFSLFRSMTSPIAAGPSAQRHPAVAGYRVFYEDDRAGNWDIYVYDTFPGNDYDPPPAVRETQLTSDPADQLDPATDGDVVVYEDKSRGNWDIAVWSIASGTGSVITSNTADQVDPAVDRGTVVFADRRNGNWDVYCYDLQTRKSRRLTTNGSAQTAPDIGDGVVVYQDRRNGNWDVYAFFLKSRVERRLTSNSANQTAPQVGDDRSVVYQDDRAGAPDLYVYDLKTRLTRRLTDDPSAQTEPSLVGAKVAWRDARTDAGDVYLAHLLYPSVEIQMDSDNSSNPTPYDSTVHYEGYLRLDYGSVEGLSVVVSGTGGTRKVPVVPVLDGVGRYTVTLRHVVRNVKLAALFNDPGHLPDKTGAVTVRAYAKLTTPTLTVLPYDTPFHAIDAPRDTVVTGYLKPRHRAGSRAVSIQCWRQRLVVMPGDPSWELVKTVHADVTDYNGYSRYRVTIRLSPSTWGAKWKVRAVHADGDHMKTVSSFSTAPSLKASRR